MKKNIVGGLFILVCLITTCTKETAVERKYPLTGNYADTSMKLIPVNYTFNKSKRVACFEYYGEDSFKTKDSTYHIQMSGVYYDQKNFDSCCGLIKCQPDNPQYLALKMLNNDLELCIDRYVTVNSSYDMLNKLYRNTQIDAALNYSSNAAYFYNSFSPFPGDWSRAVAEKKYIGCRKKYLGDYKYGWIQISVKNNLFSIDTIAMQK